MHVGIGKVAFVAATAAALAVTAVATAGSAAAVTPAASAYPCWTSFQTSPDTGRLFQIYRNCDSQDVRVTAGYYLPGDPVPKKLPGCHLVRANSEMVWAWDIPKPDVTYETFFC